MLYTYSDILKIKQDMQWIINEIHTNPKLRNNSNLQEFSSGLASELWAYDDLLEKVGHNGVVESVKDDCEFLDVTSDLIRKVKINIAGIN
ncbi:hypothetical protein I5449_05135 [Citrobacter sp. FDAARGOS_156]|uniref:hypothetical protein n=1 Tax=unclassified Citrobacter TaxID=2644389 RepID=UPI0018FF8D81|nr:MULTISPECIES: hypothetical protein [unclassified Citrobacter]MBJ9110767.1 hypothetical protein [Citrobacter sp. FDAARGOS_156]MDM2936995.1 hypothetical protein [Citrobacter sp. Cy082]